MNERIKKEVAWLLSQQNEDGSFMTYQKGNVENQISPYFSNIACIGLAKAGHLESVKNYMNWYFKYLNQKDKLGISGTIYDQKVHLSGEITSTEDYDSADSYAATFITLVKEYKENGGEATFLKSHEEKIKMIAQVMLEHMEDDFLTIAKKNYPVKYLMDNAEVYLGLQNMAVLCEEIFGDQEEADKFIELAEKTKKAILEKFKHENNYAFAMQGNERFPLDLTKYYPDALAQTFLVLCDVLNAKENEANHIYERYNHYHPRWTEVEEGDPFPWASNALLAVKMKDTKREELYLETKEKKFKEHHYPWHIAESGWLIQSLVEEK